MAAAPTALAPGATAPVLSKWSTTLFGFTEFDSIADSTQSFGDQAGNTVLLKPGNYAAGHGRLQFSVRNSRLGFALSSPDYHSVKASGLIEADFMGSNSISSTPNGTASAPTETQLFASPGFRIRHAIARIETPIVDILAGQYWELFGWQPYFLLSALRRPDMGGILVRRDSTPAAHEYYGP